MEPGRQVGAPRGRRELVVAGAALAVVPAVWFVRLVAATPALIVLAAAVPAACWVGVVLQVDRSEREPMRALLATFIWGAVVAAFLSSFANDHLQGWLGGLTDEVRARRLMFALGGPLVEETAKGAALLMVLAGWGSALGGVLDGIVYGALVGMGFAMTEDITYFTLATVAGGSPGLVRAIYLRAVLGGLNHAAFTATLGAGLGWAQEQRRGVGRAVAPALGFAGALLQHVAWNAFVSGRITQVLCNPEVPGGVCRDAPAEIDLLVTIPLLVATFVGPGLLALGVMVAFARRSRSRRRRFGPR